MKRKTLSQTSFCEIGGAGKISRKKSNRCVLYRHKGDMVWQGVSDEPYKKTVAGGWAHVIRRALIGGRGESTKFHVRYFEIGPGGSSSLERHRHEHVVICVKGEGVVRTGRTMRTMRYMDTLYISPETVHQLRNPYNTPFGFLCIVNARRDKPKVLD